MNAFVPLLQELNRLENAGSSDAASEQRKAALRTQVPAPVLAHYNRLVVNRVKPVAEVHHGVCGGCHLRLASWVRQAAHDDDLHVCENCGAYLVFVPDEPAEATAKRPRARPARLAMIRAAAVGAH